MLTIIGMFLWLIAFAAVFRLLFAANFTIRSQVLELLILLLFAGLLVFRPHEDIFGGEDPGSYINSGITYNRQKQLFYIDELLSKVPPEIRPSFYYGHSGYGPTKDACLWIRNTDLAMVGPHFQPAYPLMIASAVRLGTSSWALFVVPLFAILTALALRALALQTIPCRWSGFIAFILFICVPLTVWHARCARPEIIASFMFFAGCALTVRAWQERPWRNMIDLALGALCIGAAPFFHITAWILVIPAFLIILAGLVFKGRIDFLPHPVIICLTTGAFYAQTIHVTNYYTVKRFLDPVFMRPEVIVGGFILLALLTLLAKKTRVSRSDQDMPRQSSPSLFLSITLAIVLTSFLMTIMYFRNIYGDLPVLGRPIRNYLYLTDFKVVTNMLSIPVMLLIFAGMIAWMTGKARERDLRIILVMVAFPAIMLTGNINDFMMTRYLMVAFVPIAALFLTGLIFFILPKETGFLKPVILCALVCALAVNKRVPLVMTVEHEGFCRFLRPFAESIKLNNGILLCEYSRIAAPLEHFFGISTLGMDNETQNNYEKMEKAWAAIMKSDPERNAFFITPYHAPTSKYFNFETVFTDSFHDRRIKQARQGLPTEVGKSELTLRLYRMKFKQSEHQLKETVGQPTVTIPDAGNMGLRHFANMRNEPYSGQTGEIRAITVNIPELPEITRKSAESLMSIPPQPTISARWARSSAGVLLPASHRHSSLLMIHLKAPDPDGSGAVTLQMTWGKDKLGEPRKVMAGNWQWQAWQLPPLSGDSRDDLEWLTFETVPAWNPGKPNFPKDLGILISRIMYLPVGNQ